MYKQVSGPLLCQNKVNVGINSAFTQSTTKHTGKCNQCRCVQVWILGQFHNPIKIIFRFTHLQTR